MNEDEKLTEERGVDYNALVYFNDGFAAFQRRIMKACKYQKKLFEEVEEKTPDVFRMYTYGHRLMKEREVLKKKFDQLCAISPSHAQNLTLYAGFLEVVLNDSESAYALHEKHAQLANKHLDSLKNSTELVKDKYEINSLTAIIVASGEINRLGFCLSANNLLETLYGFTDKDLIGQNVSKMVPEYYRADHEEHFKRFFEREEETRPVLNTERIVYAQNFRGYIVPSSIMIKTLPEVNGYLKIVAFLTPSDKLNKNPTRSQCMWTDY
jgi:PAS domain S-box-containing protein